MRFKALALFRSIHGWVPPCCTQSTGFLGCLKTQFSDNLSDGVKNSSLDKASFAGQEADRVNDIVDYPPGN
jgi:hypothetical protein